MSRPVNANGVQMAFVPSGEQFEISSGAQRAVIVEVGGGVREYDVAGRAVLDSYPSSAICDGAHGTPLIPWPNRLDRGRYSFGGRDLQLTLSEPARGNAIHGLLRWRPWRALERERDRVVMGARLLPEPGYPFALELTIAYELGDAGLTVTTIARNHGDDDCPYGAGQHPYLSPGRGQIDDCTLELAAATRILTDPERAVPVGREPVAGTPFDFRDARALGAQALDCGFTDLTAGAGEPVARLAGDDGAVVELSLDEHYPFVQLYSGDTLAPERRRLGLAVEPMTCASNAFRSGDGLVALRAGEAHECRWSVRLR